MNKRLVMIINFIAILIVMSIVIGYSYFSSKSIVENRLREFEDLTVSMIQPTTYFLYGAQRVVNTWGHYINSEFFTIEKAIEFLQKAKDHDKEIDIQVLFVDQKENVGFSVDATLKNPSSSEVRYSSDYLFDDLPTSDDVKTFQDGSEKIRMTRMFTNQINGKQSVAFYHPITLQDSQNGKERSGVVMLVIPVSTFDYNLKISNSNFETASLIIVTQNGDYISRNNNFKNTNVFEFLNSYNKYNSEEMAKLKEMFTSGHGIFPALNSKRESVHIAYAAESDDNDFIIVSMLNDRTIKENKIDFSLVSAIGFSLLTLLLFNIIVVLAANRNLNDAVKEADKANHAKSEFLSSMSHDIRTPLNAILGFTYIAQQNLENKEVLDDKLTKISRAGNHLLMLINDVLDISQIESNNLSLEHNTVSIEQIVGTLQSVTEPIAKTKKIDFELVTNNIKFPYVVTDQLRLNQIYVNLVGNALKYTKNGGNVKFVLEEVETENKNSICLCATVSDTGVGMSKEFLPHMFEAFTRQEDGRTSKIAGTGLGLAITKRLVELMNGTITCTSEVDKGTTFTVKIEMPTAETPVEKIGDNPKEQTETMHVLVAEDNDINWEVVSTMLEIGGFTSERAENGEIALQMLQKSPNKFSLVLMDVSMPVMDGLEATRKIRSVKNSTVNSIPIIALTADAFSDNVNECFQVGMNAHLTKPVRMDELLNAINKIKRI